MNDNSNLNISKKSFFTSFYILLGLMILSGILTNIIPAGSFERKLVNGDLVVVKDSFKFISDLSYPIWRWFTAPFEILAGSGSIIIIAIIIFILVIGGAFAILNKCNVFQYIIGKIINKLSNRKYFLMMSVIFVFMIIGSTIGIFEEVVPLVPIIVALSLSIGWDSMVGLAMSTLAVGFGFSTAISNPFTVSVAQRLAMLPYLSGAWLRIVSFVLIYGILCLFIYNYTKHIEKNNLMSLTYENDIKKRKNITGSSFNIENLNNARKASISFITCIALVFIILFLIPFFSTLQDYSLPLVGIIFLFGGIISGFVGGLKSKEVFKTFISGASALAPGIILILMAGSIKHIISSGGIMDTILYYASNKITEANPIISPILVYLLVIGLNFFIASGSAKAFLLIPIIIPLADLIGLSRQLAVLAFVFGDGFSNVFFPTNPVLLISLGLTDTSYPKWFKFTFKLQIIIFTITCLLLVFGYYIGY